MKHNKFLTIVVLLALVVTGCSQPTPAPTAAPTTPPEPTATPTIPEPTPTPPAQDDSWQKVEQAGILRVRHLGRLSSLRISRRE